MSKRAYWRETVGKGLILLLPVLVLAPVFLVGALDYATRVGCWFDPVLLAYNALLMTAAILIPPVTTIFYVRQMRDEKERRLARDLGSGEGDPDRDRLRLIQEVRRRLDREFRFSNYAGAVVTAMLVTAMGTGILLMMKMMPIPVDGGLVSAAASQDCSGPEMQGVDFTKGASFLVVAAFMRDIGDPSKLYPNLIIGLVAFQFGFLGGWINFISQLARGYFMCDLTPNTFVYSSIRMATASVLALVLSFVIPLFFGGNAESDTFLRTLPVLAFFFGYFPSSALRMIENVSTKALVLLNMPVDRWTPLTALSGVSYLHEVRLSREGIDNVEYLSDADALDLALRTGYGYRQLDGWIGEAWLRKHLGEDYDAFADATGIRSRQGLMTFLDQWKPTPSCQRAQDLLAQALDPALHHKLEVTCLLVQEGARRVTPCAEPAELPRLPASRP